MNLPIYFSERELERYKVHGLAFVNIDEVGPVLLDRVSIGVSALCEIGPLAYVWLRRSPNKPKVTFSSDRLKGIPEKALKVDQSRTLESVVLTNWNGHNNYKAELELVYLD